MKLLTVSASSGLTDKRLSILALLVALTLPVCVHAQDRDQALAGLPGVLVSVHVSGRDLPDGISDELIASDIERDLRRAGVPVLDENAMTRAPGAPVLQVSVVMVLASSANGAPLGFGYAIQVQVVENVTLERGRAETHIGGTTWQRPMTVAVASIDGAALAVDHDVREEIAKFADAWRAVNRRVEG